MTTTTPNAASGLCARAALLSTLLSHPVEAGTLWQVRDELFASQWLRDTPEAVRGLALLRESASAREGVERLAMDFQRLFTGPDARVVPLESAYRPEVKPSQLSAMYEQMGFTQPDSLPADHLASELGFFSQLPVLTPSPAQHLADFAREHLRPWAAECFAEVSMTAATLFFQGVGAIGMDFVESLPMR
ncbi:MAG TPA: hypothetical protein GX743_11460 [Actinomycetales bacterium]|nr:hypothetical protein [Actinomycetales bacterium]